MYLGGQGGTGKSRVVNALQDYFKERGELRRFRLSTYTGVAAKNIGGATLHELLQMNEMGRKTSVRARRDLAAMWDGVDYLFVDEVSMIGCEMMYNVSRGLTEVKGNTSAFGGVNLLFAGDFAQLAPVGNVRLYKEMDMGNASTSATKHAQAKVLGKLLWLSVENVVLLNEQMRQASSENEDFANLLGRLRCGQCTKGNYEVLRGRVLRNTQIWQDERRMA